MTQPNPTTTILLVRHADVHNPTDIVYGRLPRFGLSKLGREEATRTAAALAATPIQAIYSSPQLRAQQTARLIAAPHPGLTVRTSALLAEVKTGWQGTPNRVMAEKNYNFYRDRVNPEDEDVPDVLARMLRWVERTLQRHAGQTVVGVTHGDPAMMMRLFFSGQEVSIESLRQKDFYPAKGSVARLVFRDRGAVRDLRPLVTYEDPSAAEHQALEAAAEAERAASGAPAPAGPWAATSAERPAPLPPDEAPMGRSEEEMADEARRDGAAREPEALVADR